MQSPVSLHLCIAPWKPGGRVPTGPLPSTGSSCPSYAVSPAKGESAACHRLLLCCSLSASPRGSILASGAYKTPLPSFFSSSQQISKRLFLCCSSLSHLPRNPPKCWFWCKPEVHGWVNRLNHGVWYWLGLLMGLQLGGMLGGGALCEEVAHCGCDLEDTSISVSLSLYFAISASSLISLFLWSATWWVVSLLDLEPKFGLKLLEDSDQPLVWNLYKM